MKRREFGRATLGALAGIVVPSAGVDGPVSIEHVGALRRVVAELWSRDREVGGSALLTEAKGYYSTARGWLDTGTYTTAVGADLVAVAAELAACAGFIAFDASDQMKARSLLTESLILSGSTPHLAGRANGPRGNGGGPPRPGRTGRRDLPRRARYSEHVGQEQGFLLGPAGRRAGSRRGLPGGRWDGPWRAGRPRGRGPLGARAEPPQARACALDPR